MQRKQVIAQAARMPHPFTHACEHAWGACVGSMRMCRPLDDGRQTDTCAQTASKQWCRPQQGQRQLQITCLHSSTQTMHSRRYKATAFSRVGGVGMLGKSLKASQRLRHSGLAVEIAKLCSRTLSGMHMAGGATAQQTGQRIQPAQIISDQSRSARSLAVG